MHRCNPRQGSHSILEKMIRYEEWREKVTTPGQRRKSLLDSTNACLGHRGKKPQVTIVHKEEIENEDMKSCRVGRHCDRMGWAAKQYLPRGQPGHLWTPNEGQSCIHGSRFHLTSQLGWRRPKVQVLLTLQGKERPYFLSFSCVRNCCWADDICCLAKSCEWPVYW